MKLACLVLLLAVVSFSDAHQYDDETASLMSYLLARMERLESKIKDLSYSKTSRSLSYSKVTRDLSYSKDLSHSRRSRDTNKEKPQCNCPPGTVTYVRWGNSTCPYGAHAIYSGFTAGSWYDHHGSAVEPLCLPPNPQYLKSQPGYQNHARVYGAEYQTNPGPLNHADNRNIPCALCQAYARTSVIMIPSRYDCPPGWITEYYGYLMAGHAGHKSGTTYTCMDKSLEQIEGSGADTNGRLFYTVEAHCKHYIPCSDKELTCVVCTK